MKKRMLASLLGTFAISSLFGCEQLWGPYIGTIVYPNFESCEKALCRAPYSGGTCAEFSADNGWRACDLASLGAEKYAKCLNGADQALAVSCTTSPPPDMLPSSPIEGTKDVGVRTALAADATPLTCVPNAGTIVFQATTTAPAWMYTPCTWLKTSAAQARAIVRINLLATDKPQAYKLDPATVVTSQNATHGLVMISDQWYWLNNTSAPTDVRVISGAKDSASQPLSFRIFDPVAANDQACLGNQPDACDIAP